MGERVPGKRRASAPERFDVAVIGAGPAGSVTAYRLASAGASVVLLDRASFPRDKPCGGGVTARAARRLPFPIGPVIEEVVDELEVGFDYLDPVCRRLGEPLVFMTQRRRLDAFLAERAAEAGADFRDGVRVTALAAGNGAPARVETAAGAIEAAVVVGADGANGISARSLGLGGKPSHGVALEGNLPYGAVDRDRYRRRAIIDIGSVRSGYTWVFPKEEHLNFGVGGWEREGPDLRRHLARLCRAHGVSVDDLEDLRGHRLPSRAPEARLAHGRTVVVGDAAGLVDPWTGDGMFEAFASADHAAHAIGEFLEGRAAGLEPYERALRRDLDGPTALAWDVRVLHQRAPSLFYAFAKTRLGFRVMDRYLRGSGRGRRSFSYATASAAFTLAARAFGSPSRAFREPR